MQERFVDWPSFILPYFSFRLFSFSVKPPWSFGTPPQTALPYCPSTKFFVYKGCAARALPSTFYPLPFLGPPFLVQRRVCWFPNFLRCLVQPVPLFDSNLPPQTSFLRSLVLSSIQYWRITFVVLNGDSVQHPLR